MPLRRPRVLPKLAASSLLLALTAGSPAATLEWNGSRSFWELSEAWTPLGPPVAGDLAVFKLPGGGALAWGDGTGNRQAGQLHLQAGAWTFDNPSATQHQLTLASPNSAQFLLGGAGSALYWRGLRLQVASGFGQVDAGTLLTLDRGSGGQAGRIDIASVFTVAGTLNVINGSILTSNSAAVRNAGGAAAATVGGVGSAWNVTNALLVGGPGATTLAIEAGGLVTAPGIRIGQVPSAAGAITVGGTGAQLASGSDLAIGFRGVGQLSVAAGGRLDSAATELGSFAGASGTLAIAGPGAQWAGTGNLVIGNAGQGQLSLAGGAQATTSGSARLGAAVGGSGGAMLDGAGTLWGLGGELRVGDLGSGTLQVQAGARLDSSLDAHVGGSADGSGSNPGTGTAMVSGVGSQWNHAGNLFVGSGGQGTLGIGGGALVGNNVAQVGYGFGAIGTVTVSGAGSQWHNAGDLYLGRNGQATLDIVAGGRVDNPIGRMAHNPGASASVSVAGAGSQWHNAGDLFVGHRGTAVLDISGGGLVANVNGYLGTFASSTAQATVRGAGSLWDNAGTLNIGMYGKGTLTVEDGGRVISSGNGSIGSYLAATGMVTVGGADARWEHGGDLRVGGAADAGAGGSGQLQIDGGGQVAVAGALTNWDRIALAGGSLQVGQALNNLPGGQIGGHGHFAAAGGWSNQGQLSFAGGMAEIHGRLELLGAGGLLTATGATARFHGEVVHNGAAIVTEAGAANIFLGALRGAGAFGGSGLVLVEGALHPGNSAALLSLGGDLQLGAQASTHLELAGLLRGSEHDALDVAGLLTLGGDLRVELLGGYAPALGDRFDLAAADTIAGSFAARTLPALSPGLAWELALLPDLDGGDTDVLRLSVTAVPEPHPALLLGGGLLGLMAWRRRTQRR